MGKFGVKGKDSAAHEQYSSGCFGIQGLSPIARPGRFLARSTSHPVVARSDCTKILLAAAGLKRTRPFYIIVFNERHLRHVLSSYFQYYHRTRTHLSLDKDCPQPRPIQPPSAGKIIAFPEVGGLHHRYERRAA